MIIGFSGSDGLCRVSFQCKCKKKIKSNQTLVYIAFKKAYIFITLPIESIR